MKYVLMEDNRAICVLDEQQLKKYNKMIEDGTWMQKAVFLYEIQEIKKNHNLKLSFSEEGYEKTVVYYTLRKYHFQFPNDAGYGDSEYQEWVDHFITYLGRLEIAVRKFKIVDRIEYINLMLNILEGQEKEDFIKKMKLNREEIKI